ncbi:DUF5723 family protein [Reichenbachiella carrageenanivorans]|uniref:DUF5723 family protein n=1 Tax=Reichenbachiella carrageenanivorans TaxID=2979869 RepID=A0ABY6CZY1_9BACT|nr:DUF5723 family protein [Reichenbachiella carrageenanivorans]UXX78945.1 DUF5723 family protein [Reichenbachiella carrageenanivorans]
MTVAKAQSDLTFYHMGELTPQSNIYNPVFFPDADFYLSLPVISGINTNISNSFNYNDMFDAISGTDSVQFVPEKLLSNMKQGDRLSFDGSISLFQMGFHVGRGAVQVFANERVKSSFYYPKRMLEYILHGNGEFLDQEVTENNLRGGGTYYREYGVGYSHEWMIMGNKKLRVGMKVKYLQGFAQAQVDKDASVSFLTDAEGYNVNVSTNKPVINTAGFDMFDEEGYIISNPNSGYGFDFGADLQLTPKLNVAVSINDIGSITWKEGVKNYQLEESEVVFGGLNLEDLDDAGDILKDTLEQLFDYSENFEGFKSKLNTRVFVSGAYKVIPKGTVSATVMTRNDLGNLSFTYGLGYTHRLGRMLTVSTSVSKKPSQGFAIGGGLGARLGFLQLYTSVDNFIGAGDVRKIKNLNVRAGVNFLFGYHSVKKQKEPKVKPVKQEISPFPEGYDLDHLEQQLDSQEESLPVEESQLD